MDNNVDIIGKYYQDGEIVEWSSRPQPFKVKSGCYAKPMTTRLVISLIAAIALVAAYILAANATNSKVGIAGIIIAVVIPGFIAVDPYLNKRRMIKNARYVITNSRLYVQVDSKNVRYINLDDISNIQYVGAENGCGHIIISSDPAAAVAENKLRKVAMSPALVKEDVSNQVFCEAKTVVLYNIANPEDAMGLFHSKAA